MSGPNAREEKSNAPSEQFNATGTDEEDSDDDDTGAGGADDDTTA